MLSNSRNSLITVQLGACHHKQLSWASGTILYDHGEATYPKPMMFEQFFGGQFGNDYGDWERWTVLGVKKTDTVNNHTTYYVHTYYYIYDIHCFKERSIAGLCPSLPGRNSLNPSRFLSTFSICRKSEPLRTVQCLGTILQCNQCQITPLSLSFSFP